MEYSRRLPVAFDADLAFLRLGVLLGAEGPVEIEPAMVEECRDVRVLSRVDGPSGLRLAVMCALI